MHEFGIAQGLLETVLARVDEKDVSHIEWIKLEIGILSGVEDEALRFAFSVLSEGTLADHAELKIDKIPLKCFCASCRKDFECRPFAYRCPDCGTASNNIKTGKELNLVAMEVT